MWAKGGKLKRMAAKAGVSEEDFVKAAIAEHGTAYMAAKRLGVAVNALHYWTVPLEQRRAEARAAQARRNARAAGNAPTA